MRSSRWPKLGASAFWILFAFGGANHATAGEDRSYPWLAAGRNIETIAARMAPPAGYRRVALAPDSFADWLRHLPLKPRGSPVRLHDGRLKARQDVHAAVVDMDVGAKDLQQCADAVIRLRAEYLYSARRSGAIHFNFTSGKRIDFHRWAAGWRPRVAGNRVRWRRGGAVGTSYSSLRAYLEVVFIYAGSYSLAREMVPVADLQDLAIGDVFLEGGFPGHAVTVVDLAAHPDSGRKVFLLAQSYMPAQELHVLRNPSEPRLGPWYELGAGQVLTTPEWRFEWTALRRFTTETVNSD